ncbi:MAG TPA: HAD-IA family hydrolase, partial [Pontiella sp.]|nr:HAD-IA family hydrolase [Pontiella sp.]
WSIDQLTDIWSQVFTLNQEGWRLYQEAALAGVPVYMLSNIAQFHINAIKRNWPTFFDDAHGLFLSYQIGVRKPHPGIYQHVLDELGVEGEECFFIDDLPPNIEAARAAGMHAHQFIPGSQASIREAARRFFGWKV